MRVPFNIISLMFRKTTCKMKNSLKIIYNNITFFSHKFILQMKCYLAVNRSLKCILKRPCVVTQLYKNNHFESSRDH